jgi:ArsR family transcriptional regulator
MDEARFVKILKALADPKRLRMVQEIAKAGELSCGQIGGRFNLSQPTISHHLKILADAGLLQAREAGQHHFISVDADLIQQVTDFFPKGLRVSSKRR